MNGDEIFLEQQRRIEAKLDALGEKIDKINDDRHELEKKFADLQYKIADLERDILCIKNKPEKNREAMRYWLGVITSLVGSGFVIAILKYFEVIK